MRSHVRAVVAGVACICGCAGLLGVDDVGYGGADGGLAADASVDGLAPTDAALGTDGAATDGSVDDASDGSARPPARIYVVGGGRSFGEIVASVYSAPINPDRTLGDWRVEPPLPRPAGWY